MLKIVVILQLLLNHFFLS